MKIAYKIIEEKIKIDEYDLHCVYGIEAQMGKESCVVRDISPDKRETENILHLLDKAQVHPIHLYDIIIDLLGQSAAAPFAQARHGSLY